MNFIDVPIFYWLNSFSGINPILDGLILFFAKYHIYVMIGAVLAIYVKFLLPSLFQKSPAFQAPPLQRGKAEWDFFLYVILSAVIARFGVTELIRFFHSRPRPFDLPAEVLTKAGINQINQLIPHAIGGSFPSGHAAFAFALAAAASFYYPRLGIFFWTSAVLIGLSRIAAGVHWPSDILAGAIIGAGTALVLRYITAKIKKAALPPPTKRTF